MGMMSEFKDFALKGNVMDLAVGVIIGGAFGKIVDSAVGDVIMPIVGKIFGGLDFSNAFIPLAGQTAGLIDTIKTAQQIIDDTVAEFFAISQRMGALAAARSFG